MIRFYPTEEDVCPSFNACPYVFAAQAVSGECASVHVKGQPLKGLAMGIRCGARDRLSV